MRTFIAVQLLETLEYKVESHLHEAIVSYQNLPAGVLLNPAADGGWSIAQILEHLNSYGHYYLPHMKKAVEESIQEPPAVFRSSWLGNYFTKMMDPDTGKKKYKAFKNHIPSPTPDAHQVVAEFIRQQEDLLGYLRKARKTNLNAVKIPVSISKWIRLSLGDTFRFFIAHNERHMRQAGRNLQSGTGSQESGVNSREKDVAHADKSVNNMFIHAEDLMLRTQQFLAGENHRLNKLLGGRSL